LEDAVAAAVAGGLRTLEITLNLPEAFDQIAVVKNDMETISKSAPELFSMRHPPKKRLPRARNSSSCVLAARRDRICKSWSVPFFPAQ